MTPGSPRWVSNSSKRACAWSNAGHMVVHGGRGAGNAKGKRERRGVSLLPWSDVRQLLRLGGGVGLLAVAPVVLLLELLDAAGGVDELHLAGEERVARRADFDGNVLAGAARGELVAAAAGDG